MKWLSQCSKSEQLILSAIIALAQQLEGDLLDYTNALLDLNRKYYGKAMRRPSTLNPSPGSITVQRSAPHARKRYGQ